MAKRVCHPEPGPEPCPETSSGSIEFDLRFRDLLLAGLVKIWDDFAPTSGSVDFILWLSYSFNERIVNCGKERSLSSSSDGRSERGGSDPDVTFRPFPQG